MALQKRKNRLFMSKNVIYDENAHQFALSNESGGSSADIPTGTNRQVLGYVGGEPQAVTLGWMQFSDLEAPPEFDSGVLAGTTFNPDGTALFYFHEINSGVNAPAKTNTIPVYGSNGVLKVNNGVADTDAVNVAQLNERTIPIVPQTGQFILMSIEGVLTWVEN